MSSSGATTCEIGFDLGHGQVGLLSTGGVYDAQDVAAGRSPWTPDSTYGAPGLTSLATLAQYKAANEWVACQTDTGIIRLGTHCGPHDPAVAPYPFKKALGRNAGTGVGTSAG